jgi:hypothetical protein
MQLMDDLTPLQRAQMILNAFKSEIIAQLSDEELALLVGVLPETIRKARFS